MRSIPTSTATFLIAFVLAFGSGLIPATTQQDDITTMNKRSRDLFVKGDYGAALLEAEKLKAAVRAKFGTGYTNNFPKVLDNTSYAQSLEVATTLNDLALVFASQGKYGEAEGLLEHALMIRSNSLERLSPKVASVYNVMGPPITDSKRDVAMIPSLANVYWARGKYGETEKLCKCALDIGEFWSTMKFYDAAAQTFSGLAAVYRAQGRRGDADMLEKRALEFKKTMPSR